MPASGSFASLLSHHGAAETPPECGAGDGHYVRLEFYHRATTLFALAQARRRHLGGLGQEGRSWLSEQRASSAGPMGSNIGSLDRRPASGPPPGRRAATVITFGGDPRMTRCCSGLLEAAGEWSPEGQKWEEQ